jgi:hypothetical protein
MVVVLYESSVLKYQASDVKIGLKISINKERSLLLYIKHIKLIDLMKICMLKNNFLGSDR